MSVLITISDLLIHSVVGLNPRQGSKESSRAEIGKYQCKHEAQIYFEMFLKAVIWTKKSLWDFQLQWKHYQVLLYCSFSWTSSVTLVETRYQASVHCTCQFCFNLPSLCFHYSDTLFCCVTMSMSFIFVLYYRNNQPHIVIICDVKLVTVQPNETCNKADFS